MRNFMKALCGIVLAALIAVPVSVCADGVSIGAWGRAVFVPAVSNQAGETVPIDTASWGWNSRIGFTVHGDSEKVGFQADINVDSGSIGTHDQQKIWAKLTDTVTFEFGPNVFYDAIRGNSAFGSWDYLRFNGIQGEDNIFARARAGENAAAGGILHIDTDSLHAYAVLNVVEDSEYTTAKMMERGQYGAGYAIEGLGMARLQYIGKAYDKDPDSDELESYGVINGAFKLDQAIENLYADIGFFMPTDSDNTNGDLTKIAAYARYKFGQATLHLLGEAALDKADAEGEEGTGIKCGAGVDYDLGNGLTLNTDLRYHNKNAVAVADVDSQLGFLVGVKKFIGNGVIGIGIEGTTHDFGGGVVSKENADDFAWAVPIILEYWF